MTLANLLQSAPGIVAAVGVGGIVGAVIVQWGNAATQRRREAREDNGVRIQLRGMVRELELVVDHVYKTGSF